MSASVDCNPALEPAHDSRGCQAVPGRVLGAAWSTQSGLSLLDSSDPRLTDGSVADNQTMHPSLASPDVVLARWQVRRKSDQAGHTVHLAAAD